MDLSTCKSAQVDKNAQNAASKYADGTSIVRRVITGGEITFDLRDMDVFASGVWRVRGKTWRYVQGGRFGGRRFHREVMRAGPGEVVDHIDGNTLNNCRSNLRKCTTQQNIRNQKPHEGRKLKGITLQASGKYRAQIMYQRVKINLGNYSTAEAAAQAYDAHARKLFGDYAWCNFPVPQKPEISTVAL